MKIRLLSAALAVCTALVMGGCSRPVDGYTSAQGSVGASHDDALVFAADSDTDQVYVYDTVGEKLVATVKVGKSPQKVLVANDDTVFVTNRMDRSVSVIRRGEWTEAVRLQVGVEPVSMALTGDQRTLYVVSSTALDTPELGTLTAIDVRTLQTKWEVKVGHEPRGLALVDGNKAIVSLFKDGDVVLVDLSNGKLLSGTQKTEIFQQLNNAALGGSTFGGSGGGFEPKRDPSQTGNSFAIQTSRPRGMEALAVSPDGRQVYAASRLSSDGLLPSTPSVTSCLDGTCPIDGQISGGGGDGYSGGSCGATAVSSPALLTFNQDATPRLDDVLNCQTQNADQPPMILGSGDAKVPLQGPTALVVDLTGSFAYVVNHDSNNVAIVATSQHALTQQGGFDKGGAPTPAGGFGGAGGSGEFQSSAPSTVNSVVAVGAGPTGIALAKDGNRAWVYNSFDHSISEIAHSKDGVLKATKTVVLGGDVLPPDVVIGRKLFFTTNDSRMDDLATGISCGTCHLDGREDGHVWNFTQGPRQTPSLAGRKLAQTAPFHWGGEFATIGDFMTHTVTNRMGGTGVDATMERQISAFIGTIPAADNPNAGLQPTAAQLHGAEVFAAARCGTCHAGEALTDNSFANVGTLVTTGNVQDDLTHLSKGLNTPSLMGIGRSAPFLHDGSAATLRERITKGTDSHGTTSTLSTPDIDDLVAYLQTL